MTESKKWLPVFTEFIKHLRINSKEVQSVDERGVQLNLWTSQRIFLEKVCEGLDDGVRTFVCLKARQLGITTISLAFDLFWMIMYPGTIGALVTESDKNSQVFRETITRYFNSFPANFFGSKLTITGNNDSFITFSNGSRLDFLVAGVKNKANWSEGRAYSYAHLTEISKYGSEAGLASFRETLAESNPDRFYIYESTANGFNHFREMWLDAKNDTITKKSVFLGWWSKDINRIEKTDRRYAVHGTAPLNAEEREKKKKVKEIYDFEITQEQIAWYRWRKSDKSQTDQSMNQNLPWTEEDAFVMTGYSFFPMRQIQKDYIRITEGDQNNPPSQFQAFTFHLGNDFTDARMERIIDKRQINDVTLRMWDQPVADAYYVIGCDPAFGQNENKDRHAISVWRCYADKLVQVAEYADSEVPTQAAAWVLAYLAGIYKNCEINIDLTGGPGKAIMLEWDHLRQRLNADMYRMKPGVFDWDDFLMNAKWYLFNKINAFGKPSHKGWEGNNREKVYLCNSFKDSYVTNQLEIHSKFLCEEMATVVVKGVAIEAQGRAKDDRVFAAMLANLSWKENIRQNLIAQNYAYDVISAKENGEISVGESIINDIVHNFFKNAEQAAEFYQPTDILTQRGLR